MTVAPRLESPGYYASHWRSLDYFNLYRLVLALALVFTGILFSGTDLFRPGAGTLYLRTALVYLVVTALLVLAIRARWPSFQVQLTTHIVVDILFIVLMMNTSDRLAGGLGLLLVVSIASGGLVGSGRLTLLYAALASIAVLLQHSLAVVRDNSGLDSYFQVGLLCMGYFATGLLAHTLARRALASEQLAARQAGELALLNRINALATEHSPHGILAVAADATLRHINARGLALLGCAQTPPAGTPLADIAPFLLDDLGDCRAPESPGRTHVTAHARFRVRCIPLERGDGGVVMILEDLLAAEEAAQRVKLAALGRLTANIAHEIRNPLSAISHAAQLLREDDPGGSTARLAQIIENNARRLDRLVQDVLSLNRRNRTRPVTITAGDLATLIREILDAEEIPASAVIVDMQPRLRFCFDPEHLRQILWNLVRNAWRHCTQGEASVRIALAEAAGVATLDIVDDGHGVPADDVPKLFEPFFTTDAQGTGLGLFLARELADANHASLSYAGNAPGARFRLTLRAQDCR